MTGSLALGAAETAKLKQKAKSEATAKIAKTFLITVKTSLEICNYSIIQNNQFFAYCPEKIIFRHAV
jgi:hypothetical protein